jgi:hypothetical protein
MAKAALRHTYACILLIIFFWKRCICRVGFTADGDVARSRRFPDFWWLYTICGPNGGPAMIAWVLAFLGFPPPLGIPGSLKGLFQLPF